MLTYQPWHNTNVKHSVVLEAHKQFMNDRRVKDPKHTPYDNRHITKNSCKK